MCYVVGSGENLSIAAIPELGIIDSELPTSSGLLETRKDHLKTPGDLFTCSERVLCEHPVVEELQGSNVEAKLDLAPRRLDPITAPVAPSPDSRKESRID